MSRTQSRNFARFSSRIDRRESSGASSPRRARLEVLEDRRVLSFSAAVPYSVSPSPAAVIARDFNGDGRPDLAVANNPGSIDTLLGNSDGTFQAPANIPLRFGTRSLAAGDLNADGTIDIVTANHAGIFSAGSISMVYGNGDGTFQPPLYKTALGDTPISVDLGDIDNDGDLDMVVTTKIFQYTEPTFKVRIFDYYVLTYINNLDVVNHQASLILTYANYLYTTDYYNLPDSIKLARIDSSNGAVYVEPEANIVQVMLGYGTGRLLNPISFSVGTAPTGVSVGDLNGDGRVDLVTANSGSNNVSVLLATGDSTLFRPAVNYPVGTSPSSVAIADMNGDGVLDLVSTNTGSNTVSVLLGHGNGTFLSAGSYATGTGPISVAAGSFNGDTSPSGRPYNDLAVVNTTGDGLSVLLNTPPWPGVNTSSIANRKLFYNNTVFDDPANGVGDAAANVNDDDARSNKVAYLPGSGKSTFSNFSSFSKGINGIMFDLSTGGTHASIDLSDFQFRIAPPVATNDPNGGDGHPAWAPAPAPVSISVRSTGRGLAAGSDRVTIIWADGAIKNTWLEVQVKATNHTGMLQSATLGAGIADVFYFGNLVGDSGIGNDVDAAFTDAIDVIGARTNPASDLWDLDTNNTAGLSTAKANRYDYNRDNNVDATDIIIARANSGELGMIEIASPPHGPATGGGGSDGGDAGVASGLAALASSGSSSPTMPGVPVWLATRLEATDTHDDSRTADILYQALVSGVTIDDDDDAAAVEIDSALLDEILAGW